MTLKYTSKRPDEAFDSLQELEADWTHPTIEPESVIVVARVSRTGIAKPTTSGDWQATAGFTHVEVLDGDDAEAAEKLLAARYGARSGQDQVQLDFSTPEGSAVEVPVDDEPTDDWAYPNGEPVFSDPEPEAAPVKPIRSRAKKTTIDGPEAA